MIAVRVLDDEHMTCVAAEVESEHALHAWFKGAASHPRRGVPRIPRAVDRGDAAPRDLRRLFELTQPYPGQLAHSE